MERGGAQLLGFVRLCFIRMRPQVVAKCDMAGKRGMPSRPAMNIEEPPAVRSIAGAVAPAFEAELSAPVIAERDHSARARIKGLEGRHDGEKIDGGFGEDAGNGCRSDMFDAHDSRAKPEGDERNFLGREKSPRRIVWHERDAARHLKSRRGWAGTCGRGTR